jgi:hypothetical protein
MRVTRPGGTISAIACFCHSGNLPHYHGRYPLSGNHRIDELDLKLDRLWRRTVRPRLLGIDHTILNLDLMWHFTHTGLEDVQINGHLALVSPGDVRLSVATGAAYALARRHKELHALIRMRENHGEELDAAGFSVAEFDELIDLKRARGEYLQHNPDAAREAMEVFSESLIILQGKKPAMQSPQP